jgi:integrase/recombinase XerD
MQQGMVQSNPMGRLEPVEQIERLPRPLDPDDVTRILKAIPASNLRNRAIFMLFSETGMRVEEALSIHYADLDLTQDNEKIRVFGKGQRERTVLLVAAPESIRLLRRYLKHSRITAGSLFRGDPRYGGSSLPLDYSVLRKAWQRYCKQAGVQATIYQLRHSRATQLIQAGVPITTIRKQVGHRNLQSTLLYAEVDQATVKRDLLEYQRRKGKGV